MGDYRYKLQFIDDEKTITHEFRADINSDDLVEAIRYFLLGCSWTESQVNAMFGVEE